MCFHVVSSFSLIRRKYRRKSESDLFDLDRNSEIRYLENDTREKYDSSVSSMYVGLEIPFSLGSEVLLARSCSPATYKQGTEQAETRKLKATRWCWKRCRRTNVTLQQYQVYEGQKKAKASSVFDVGEAGRGQATQSIIRYRRS